MRRGNRAQVRQAKLGLGWCVACDLARVTDGGKCPRCGVRNNRRRAKHHEPTERE